MMKKVLVFLPLVLSFFLVACQAAPEPTATSSPPTLTATSLPTATATPEPEADTWLVMIYIDADDEVLEEALFVALNDAELVGSTDQVTVVVQMDRYVGAIDLDGDWTTTKRFLVTYDGDLEQFNKRTSIELQDLGEVNSGDYHTLVDFATWAIEKYPAQRHALILSDHGGGWTGGWVDADPGEGAAFTTNDIDQTLWDILQATGIGQFDLLAFEACLMANVEALQPSRPMQNMQLPLKKLSVVTGWPMEDSLANWCKTQAWMAELWLQPF